MRFLLSILLTAFIFGRASSQPSIEQLKNQVAIAKSDTTRLGAYIEIGTRYYDNAKIDSSMYYAKKAEKLSSKYPHYPKAFILWNLLGVLYDEMVYNHELPDSDTLAIYYFKKAIISASRHNNHEYLLMAKYNLTDHFTSINDYSSLFKNSISLLSIIEQHPKLTKLDSIVYTRVCINLCIAIDFDMKSKRFERYITLAERYCPNENEKFSIKLLRFEQLCVSTGLKDEQKVLHAYQELREHERIYAKREDKKLECILYLATYYLQNGQYDKAHSLCVDATFKPNSPSDYKDNIESLKALILGEIYFKKGTYTKTLAQLQKEIPFYNERLAPGEHHESFTFNMLLSNVYLALNDYKNAYKYKLLADKTKEETFGITLQNTIAERENAYLESVKQREIEKQKMATTLKEQQLEAEKKQKYFYLALFVVALLSTAGAVYSFNEKRKLNERLANKNEIITEQVAELAKTNKVKDRIFALLSHDLRVPINRLIMGLNTSHNDPKPIRHELYNVQDVLNNVLYWATMQLKGIEVVQTEIPLKALTASLINEYQQIIDDKELTVINAIEEKQVLYSDENYLKIVLRNILSNAIKFSNTSGYIRLGCTPQKNGGVQISIKDTGIGMSKDEIDKTTNYPVPKSGTYKEQGTGLGLTLSNEIISKLNGKLLIESQPNEGTTVVIELG